MGGREKSRRRENKVGGQGERGGEDEWRIPFWNVAGLGNKDKEF